MAELPVIDNVSRVAFNWGPLVATNVMHFHQEVIDSDGLFGALDANVNGSMWQICSTTQRVQEIIITPLDGSGFTASIVPPATAKWKGNSPGESMPACCAVVSKRSLIRGRSFTGRSFIGPVTENGVANGFLSGTQGSEMATGWTNFQLAMAADGAHEVVASYKLAAGTPVAAYLVRNALGTLRPRQSRLAP